MSSRNSDEQDRVRDLVDAGAEITGPALAGAAGAVAGYVISGPSGAAAGGALGGAAAFPTRNVLQDMAHGALDFTYRMLGQREKVRVGAVVVYCYEKFQENIKAGQQPRQDGFFDDAPNNRSADKEIFEGIMLAAQREHQEKKLRFFGNLVANIAFESDIDRAQATYLIKLAEDLSYRQLCLLALVERKDQVEVQLREDRYTSGDIVTVELLVLLQEIVTLHSFGLIGGGITTVWLNGIRDIAPAALAVYGVGSILHDLMELDQVLVEDLNPLAELLQ